MLENLLLSVTSWVLCPFKNSHIPLWTSLLKQTLRMYWMSYWIKINSLRKDVHKLDLWEGKRWSSLLMISICLLCKNMEPSLLMNCSDKLSIKEDFMIWKSSSFYRCLTVTSSPAALHPEEEETKLLLVFLDTLTWSGLQIYQ